MPQSCGNHHIYLRRNFGNRAEDLFSGISLYMETMKSGGVSLKQWLPMNHMPEVNVLKFEVKAKVLEFNNFK